MAKKTKSSIQSDPDQDMDNDYEGKRDASTLTDAAAIQNDPDRHARAAKHLEKNAASAKSAHDTARKSLMKKTKKRMQKTFGQNGQGTFQQTKDQEQGDAEKIVAQDD
jgi:hypothetical protein